MANLHLHEELTLLALKDKEGTLHFGSMFPHAIAGGALAELIMNKKIQVDGKGRRKKAVVVDDTPTGDEFLDECLKKVSKYKKRKPIAYFFNSISTISKMKHKIAKNLCNKGILTESEDTILLFFSRKTYPEINPIPESKIIKKITDAIEGDSEQIDARTSVLISLADVTGILQYAIGKSLRKKRKKRIKEIVNCNLVAKETKEAIEAAQAAIIVAAVIPAIVTTTVVH